MERDHAEDRSQSIGHHQAALSEVSAISKRGQKGSSQVIGGDQQQPYVRGRKGKDRRKAARRLDDFGPDLCQ